MVVVVGESSSLVEVEKKEEGEGEGEGEEGGGRPKLSEVDGMRGVSTSTAPTE